VNRLYIVEGLPCTGKSTMSEYISKLISKNHSKVVFFDEGTCNHPADYEFHAYVEGCEESAFTDKEMALIKKYGEPKSDGFVVSLADFSGESFDKLLKYKIYDSLPWEKEKPLMLDKWREFVNNTDKDTIYVFNCVLLQNPMCETMMRFNMSEEESYAYINDIVKIIEPLNPCVVYLKNDDIAQSVMKASEEREGWLDAVMSYHTNGGYGISINAKGFEGYITCLKERQRRELSILNKLPVMSVVVDNPQRDYSKAYSNINELVECKMQITDFNDLSDKSCWIEKIRGCDWAAAKLLASFMSENRFDEVLDGRLLIMTDCEKLVSFCTLTKRDCIDDDTLYPWIGFVYTSPEYRGNRYSGRLIDYACLLAKQQGARKVYIATDHVGLYEKYGFSYLENRIDIYNDDSRIYYKSL